MSAKLIDQSDSFVFGYSKLDVMFGRKAIDGVRLHSATSPRPRSNSAKRS